MPFTGKGFPVNVRVLQFSFWHNLVRLFDAFCSTSLLFRFQRVVNVRYDSVQLTGGIVSVGEYYLSVYIGGIPFRVQIDTGSSTLAVPMNTCDTCRVDSSKYSIKLSSSGKARMIPCTDRGCTRNICDAFGCSKCSSYGACCADQEPNACGFFLRYGDGSGAMGALLTDEIRIGNTTGGVAFGGILHDTTNFEQSSVDGILGLGYAALGCTPSCVEPVFDSLLRQAKIDDDVFSICINRQGGRLVLGGYDPSMAASDIQFVPMKLSSPPTYYSVSLGGSIQVADEILALPEFDIGIVDSGTTLLVMSDAAFNKLRSHFQSNYCAVPGLCGSKTWFQTATCVSLYEEELQKLPTLKLRIANTIDLELNPKDYMLTYHQAGETYYCLGIESLPSDGSSLVILGNTVMSKYMTVFDRRNSQMGFALAGDCHIVGCERHLTCEACSTDPQCTYHIPSRTCRPVENSHSFLGIYPSCSGRLCFCQLAKSTEQFPQFWLLLFVSMIAIIILLQYIVVRYCIRRRYPLLSPSETQFLRSSTAIDYSPSNEA
eukprot:jgi/Galph1/2300/GphlegSOOS_G975.1